MIMKKLRQIQRHTLKYPYVFDIYILGEIICIALIWILF